MYLFGVVAQSIGGAGGAGAGAGDAGGGQLLTPRMLAQSSHVLDGKPFDDAQPAGWQWLPLMSPWER